MDSIKGLSEDDSALCIMTEADVTDLIVDIGIKFSETKKDIAFHEYADNYFDNNLHKYEHNKNNPTFYYEMFRIRFQEIIKPLKELNCLNTLVIHKRADTNEQLEKNILVLSYLEFINSCNFQLAKESLEECVNKTIKLFKKDSEINASLFENSINEIIEFRKRNDSIYQDIKKHYTDYCSKIVN